MKISLFQGIFLAIFVGAGVIGVFVFATYNSKGSTAAVGTVNIWGVLPADKFRSMLTSQLQIEKLLKDVTYSEHNANTFKTELATAIATGNAPDLVLINQEQFLTLKSILDPIPTQTLSPRTFANTFIEEGQIFEATEGAYAIPFMVDPLVMFTNRTILSANGIVRPPSSWEAMTGLVPTVTKITANGKITRSLIALGTYNNIHNARAVLSTLFLQVGVPMSTVSVGGVRYGKLGNDNNSNGTPPGQAVLRFYTQFADPSKVSYTWDPSLTDSQQAFLTSDLALYLGFASEAAYFTAANPNLDFDVAPMPQPATANKKTTYGLLYAFAIPKGSKNPGGGYTAATLLANTAEQRIASGILGLAPATLTTLQDFPSNPILAVAYPSALYAEGWVSPAPGDTDRVFSSMIDGVTSGQFTLDSALANAEHALSALLQQP